MKRGLFILAKVAILLLIVLPAFGAGVFFLWNWLMPQIFGLHTVTFWQALGLVGLSWLLFRGPRIRGGGGWGRRRALRARWAAMTPEQREQFAKGLQGRCGRGAPEAQTSAGA